MSEQSELFSNRAVDSLTVSARYRIGTGWEVHMHFRRNGADWEGKRGHTYTGLASDELLQVVDDAIAGELGL